jgi:hypothetical protein
MTCVHVYHVGILRRRVHEVCFHMRRLQLVQYSTDNIGCWRPEVLPAVAVWVRLYAAVIMSPGSQGPGSPQALPK